MQELKSQLEQLIDKYSLLTIAEAMQEICYEKQDHVMTNYNDKQLTKYWKTCGNRMQACVNLLSKPIGHLK